MNRKANIIKFRKRKDVNIGIVVFFFILIYLTIHIYRFFTKSQIPIYEVQPGAMYSSTRSHKGIVLRDEKLFSTEIAGYVNYYYREGARVSRNGTVYSIDSNRDIYSLLSGEISELKLSDDDIAKMKRLITAQLSMVEKAGELKTAKTEILSGYQRMLDETLMEQLNQIVLSTGIASDFHVVRSLGSGIISYIADAYTGLGEDAVTAFLFEADYTADILYTPELIAANSPIYKMIYGDEWTIVVLLDETDYLQLAEKRTAVFTIEEDGRKCSAPITCYQKGNSYFAKLEMKKYLAEYTTERFLTVSFELPTVSGLKIPETAITFKDYYRIPDTYFTNGGNEAEEVKGLLTETFNAETGEKQYTFLPVEIFYVSDGFTYIDTLLVPEQTYIVTPDLSARTMLYTFLNKLEGAYNINKGYAVFKRIERLQTENGYCIVRKNSGSGLSAYDHIALDASGVVEGAVIY